jgi:hypothetical protein
MDPTKARGANPMIKLPNPFMEAPMPAARVSPAVVTEPSVLVREFSGDGPCLTLGRLTKTTSQFYFYEEWKGEARYEGVKRIRINGKDRYSPAHIVPCPSCRDHAEAGIPAESTAEAED